MAATAPIDPKGAPLTDPKGDPPTDPKGTAPIDRKGAPPTDPKGDPPIVDPSSGPAGTPVKIRGRNLLAVKSVKFGGKVADFKEINPALLQATSPKGHHTGTTVDIIVETRRGKLTLKGAFTYTKAT